MRGWLRRTRDVAYLMFAPERFEDAVKVSDDDVNAYYQAHLPDFMTQDTVDVDYVEYPSKIWRKRTQFAPDRSADQGAVRCRCESIQTEELRHVEHIMLQVNASRTEQAAKAELSRHQKAYCTG